MVQILKFVCVRILFISLFLIATKFGVASDECQIDADCPKSGNLFYIYKCINHKCELVAAHLRFY
ncbi:Nodule Cysteine-Rich (NCR) secreted peptide [Medicago truncatula]|uniref:Nodule Cysteine-Rich (NCR) secreted peptide n=1 Tax=Medicago truncatula TaxID=3880 RepID=A0A072UES3_MEDTR|nr:Nodule Cysteine-Rich (NCR) secreted peptide [Medicago truncatula]